MSAVTGDGVDSLLDTIAGRLRAMKPIVELEVPYERGDVVAALHREGEVLVEVHGEGGTRVRARLPQLNLARFQEFVVDEWSPMSPLQGFVPPPYPHDRLAELKDIASAVPGGIVDCSIGTPVDPMPEVAVRALVDAASGATGYPATIGSVPYREAAAAWIARRFGCTVTEGEVVACIGTKELVASLPRALSLRDPSRDVVLYPAASYPTYEMGATLAGLRAVPVPLDERWRIDLSRVPAADADRALVLWLNDPSNPTGVTATPTEMAASVAWARERGIIVASDECYAEFTYDETGSPTAPVTALTAGLDGVLAVHSLSKRSNMAGLRAGFVAGDARARHLPRRDPQARRVDDARAGPSRCGRGARRRRPCPRAADSVREAARGRALRPRDPRPGARRRAVHLLSLVARRRRAERRLGDHRRPREDRSARRAGRLLW